MALITKTKDWWLLITGGKCANCNKKIKKPKTYCSAKCFNLMMDKIWGKI